MSVRAGDVVRLSQSYKGCFRAMGGGYHIDEFGRYLGDVIGPTRVGSDRLIVQWRSSGIRFSYDPSELEVVDV